MPGIELQTDDVVGSIDELHEAGGVSDVAHSVARGSYVTVRGWLLDRVSHRPAESIAVALTAESEVEAVMGLPRPDVAEVFGASATGSGFAAAVPADAALGLCALSLRPRRNGLRWDVALEDAVTVVPPKDPFEGFDRRPGQWAFVIDGMFVGESRVPREANGVYVVDPRVPAELRLWAIDGAALEPASAIVARFGGRFVRITSTIPRSDAAASLRAPRATMCGFAVPFIPSPVGTERVDLYALDGEGSYAHLASVRARQPNPLPASILPVTAKVQGALDALDVAGAAVEPVGDVTVTPGQALRLRGWAVDTLGPRLSGGIDVLIDDNLVGEMQTLCDRSDIAAKFAHSGLLESGFDLTLTVPGLELGPHELTVRVFSARRDAILILARRTLRVPRPGGE